MIHECIMESLMACAEGDVKKVLVVEDNEKNRELIVCVLKFHGYDVVEAENGEAGVQKAIEHLPELILMDIQMPVMNGIEALRRLKAKNETGRIKVIALTSFAMDGDGDRFIGMGFDDYISKPINIRSLPVIIKTHIAGQNEVMT